MTGIVKQRRYRFNLMTRIGRIEVLLAQILRRLEAL